MNSGGLNDNERTSKEIISTQFNMSNEEIHLDTNFEEDLDADSLDLVELIMAFEDEFDLEIDDEDVYNIKSVSDAINEIKGNLEKEK